MSYYVYVNRGFSVKFSELDIQSSNNINYEEIDEKIGKKLAKIYAEVNLVIRI